MANFVSVPRDLSRVRDKIIFGLTKRQVICFLLAALVGVPLFFVTKKITENVSAATLVMMAIMMPFFFIALYEKDGMNCETILHHMIQWRFKRPRTRPYMTENYYDAYMRQKKLEEEVEDIVISHVQKEKEKKS